ncbi:MAG: hypothetical protein H7Y03_01935 [Chitinophagaceae bacterium]|nr:hypothetical protein [Chitinophagaceae bacterium]
MERNFYDDDDFEDFLKQKADQYNLYPSDRVWDTIYRSLHARRKWYAATGALLLLTTMVFISLEIVSTGYQKAAMNIVNDSVSNAHSLLASSVTGKDISGGSISATSPSASADANSTKTNDSKKESSDESDNELPRLISNPPFAGNSLADTKEKDNRSASGKLYMPMEAPLLELNNIAGKQDKEEEEEKEKKLEINWLQDRAALRLSPFKNKRYHLQFYISPGASYRRLNNYRDTKATNNISPLSGDPINVDGIVDHQPAFGLEAGSAVLYDISDRFILKGGIQLNFVRYNISAYKSAREMTAITLSSATGSSSQQQTITSYSSIRNLGGRFPQELQNQYLQLSLPIGAEFRVLGNKRFQFNVAGTLQPTYLLYNNTYLLTSDYGNYTKQPDLVRKWNVNAAMEAYISYSFGGLRWQAGPQFRYQLLSTYTDRYPIREYLMEYGLKIGVTKTLK